MFSELERSSGNKVSFGYVTAGKLRDRVQAGELGDVAIPTLTIFDGQEKNGKITAGTTTILARSAVAVVVREGARKPDISSADAFKGSLLAMNFFSYPDPARGGAAGVLVSGIAERLGITTEINTRAKFPPEGHFAAKLVANGKADAAIAQPMEALLQPGVEIVGLLPLELRAPKSFTFASAVVTTVKATRCRAILD